MPNPVLQREFVTGLRTPRAAALGGAFLLVLGGLVMLLWPEAGVYSLAAQASRRLLLLVSLSFLALAALCAPSFTAVAISGERERQTWDLLYDSLLRPDQILVGKLAAGAGFVGLLAVAGLPMLGATFVLGGVSLGDILLLYAIVLLAGLFFSLLGLACSATLRSSYRSLVLSYVLILLVAGGAWVPSVILAGWAETLHAIHLVRALSPFAAIVSVVHPDLFARQHPVAPGAFGAFADGPVPFLLLGTLGSAALFLYCYSRLARPPQPGGHAEEPLLEEGEKTGRFPFYLIDPRRRKRMIGPWLNVIFVKEMRSKAFHRASWMVRAMAGCVVVSLLLAFLPLTNLNKVGVEIVILTCISMPLGLILLIGPVLTAGAICGERESGIFDMLRVTRVSAWTVVLGKLEVAWFFTLLLLASAFPTFFILVYIGSPPEDMAHLNRGLNLIRPFHFQFAAGWSELRQVDPSFLLGMLSAFGVMALSMLLTTLAGVTVSCFLRRSSTATALAYGLVLAYAFGTLGPYLLLGDLPRWIPETILTLNPFVAAAKAVRSEAFPELPAGIWLHHLLAVGALSLALLAVSVLRVHRLMRPDR